MKNMLEIVIKIIIAFLLRGILFCNKKEIFIVLLKIQDSIYLAKIENIRNSETEEYIPLKTSSLNVIDAIIGDIIYDEAMKLQLPIVYRCTDCKEVIFDKTKVYDGVFGDICEKCNLRINQKVDTYDNKS